MGVTRKLLNWCNSVQRATFTETDDRKAYGKTIASSVVEGCMDAALILYVPVLITCCILQGKAAKK